MRSLPEPRLLAVLALLACAPAWPATAPVPTQTEIERALDIVKADPNLLSERQQKRLVSDFDMKERKPRRDAGSLRWLADFFAWIAQGSRVLVWVLLAGLAALLVVFIVRVVLQNRMPELSRKFSAPTHVQDLDIRPESLPPDIGAAARTLWDRGQQRAALALLYRGLLSRLAHVYEVPIRDSSTEGDCLAFAARKLDAARIAYVTQLIRTWQQAIYGGLSIDTAHVWNLCAGFAQHLDEPASMDPSQRSRYSSGSPA